MSREYQKEYRKTELYNSEECKKKRSAQSKKYRDKNTEIIKVKPRVKNKNMYYYVIYRLMKLWQAMKRRCYNPKCDKYIRY